MVFRLSEESMRAEQQKLETIEQVQTKHNAELATLQEELDNIHGEQLTELITYMKQQGPEVMHDPVKAAEMYEVEYVIHSTDPSGCRWCRKEARFHSIEWSKAAGYHTWARPTTQQRHSRMYEKRDKVVTNTLLELMGANHPYVNSENMFHHGWYHAYMYVLALPKQEDIEEDLLQSLAETVEPVVKAQAVIGKQNSGANLITFRCSSKNNWVADITYNGKTDEWSFAQRHNKGKTGVTSLMELASLKDVLFGLIGMSEAVTAQAS